MGSGRTDSRADHHLADSGPAMNTLEMWVVYDHPRDFPGGYIARKWIVGEGPTAVVMWSDRLEEVQDFLENLGLVKIARHPSDDPVVMEQWI